MPNTVRQDTRAKELSGPWLFRADPDGIGEEEAWFSLDEDIAGWSEVTVPGAWDLYDQGLWSYEGVSWYAKEIPAGEVEAAKWQRVHFERVNVHARVWLNGQFLGEHVGGFLPFQFDLSPYLSIDGPNRLILRVDNVRRPNWLPGGAKVEWMLYGGILQPVWLLTTDPTYVSDFGIAAVPEGPGARVDCEVEIANRRGEEVRGTVTVRIPSDSLEAVGNATFACAPGGKTAVSLALHMPAAETWSPESPTLYTASTCLEVDGAVLDESRDSFGVRTIEARGSEILLNGEPIQIKGVNRYDEHPGFGPTVPEEIVREDLLRIKRTGANLVRVHYPQSPLTLRLMDEVGLLLMEETSLCWWKLVWFGPTPDIDDDAVIDAAEKVLEGMIRRDKNHPCVVIWSMGNECGSDTDVGVQAMRRLMRKARELDPTRLVTFVVSQSIEGHLAFDEADLVAVNVYFGVFYRETPDRITEIDSLVRIPTEQHLRETIGQVGDKPVVVAEFGNVGIRGLRGNVRYTEDHQAAYNKAVWQAISSVPGVAGGVLWCWADYNQHHDMVGLAASSPQAPFGVVTIDREPKQSLYALARMYGGEVQK